MGQEDAEVGLVGVSVAVAIAGALAARALPVSKQNAQVGLIHAAIAVKVAGNRVKVKHVRRAGVGAVVAVTISSDHGGITRDGHGAAEVITSLTVGGKQSSYLGPARAVIAEDICPAPALSGLVDPA